MELKPTKKDKRIEKIIETLKLGEKSEKTIKNYVCAINRFLAYFPHRHIAKLTEDDIIEYLKHNYLIKGCSSHTYNMNLSAIKYFYAVNFNKVFNNKLLPSAKLAKMLPLTLDKSIFIKILNEEKILEHQCWLLLAYYSGLRVEEVSRVKITDIHSKEHTLKVLGKRNKERLTFLPDITIKCLRLYYKNYYMKKYNDNRGYLFKGQRGAEHINCKSITNYFSRINMKYNLDKNLTFHSLRHSFATNFIKAGGDPFVLKSMLGHSSMSTTAIYVHTGRDFNNLQGVKYGRV